MATINKFEVETPQEVMSKFQEQLHRMRSSNNPQAVNAANSQTVISALFGSPELRKAKATESALQGALGSVSKSADESEVDFQVRQQVAVRDAMVGVDPSVAVQANDNIMRLQSQELSNRRLKVGVEGDERSLQNAIQTSVDQKTPTIFKVLPDGQMVAVNSLEADASEEEVESLRSSLAEADPGHQYVTGSGADRLKIEKVETSKSEVGGGLSKTGRRKIEQELEAGAAVMRNGVMMLNELAESPLSLVKGAETYAGATSLGQGMRRLQAGLSDEELSDAQVSEQLGWLERAMTSEQAESLRRMGVNSAVANGLVLNLGYTLAKSLDSGRLSDQDVDMAIRMITGNGDPLALKRLLRLRFEEAFNKNKTHKLRAESGALNGAVGLDKWNTLTADHGRMQEALDRFDKVIDEGGFSISLGEKFGASSNAARKAAKEPAKSSPKKIKFTIR